MSLWILALVALPITDSPKFWHRISMGIRRAKKWETIQIDAIAAVERIDMVD